VRISLTARGSQLSRESSAVALSDDGNVALVQTTQNVLTGGVAADEAATSTFAYQIGSHGVVLVDPVPGTGFGSAATFGARPISRTGRYVTFLTAKSLVPADTDTDTDVYVRDLTRGTPTLVTDAAVDASFEHSVVPLHPVDLPVPVGGPPLPFPPFKRVDPGNEDTYGYSAPSIDAAGRLVAFVLQQTLPAQGRELIDRVYVRGVAGGSLTTVDERRDTANTRSNLLEDAVIAPDGKSVAYVAAARTVWDAGAAEATNQPVLYRTVIATKARTTVTVPACDPSPEATNSCPPAPLHAFYIKGVHVSADARVILFATDLPMTASDTGQDLDLYVWQS
jgi:hypothetical protein